MPPSSRACTSKWAADPSSRLGRMARLLRPTARHRRDRDRPPPPPDRWGRSPVDRTDRGNRRLRRPLARAQARSEGRAAAAAPPAAAPASAGVSADEIRAAAHDSIRALMLIRSYRVRGHLQATLDPLGIETADQQSRADAGVLRLQPRPTWTGRSILDGVLGLQTGTIREVHGDPEAHLLRQHRHPVHAYRRAGGEVLAAGSGSRARTTSSRTASPRKASSPS